MTSTTGYIQLTDHDHRIVRRCLAFVMAIAVTLLLTWFMFVLIKNGNNALDESPTYKLLDFVRVAKSEEVHKKSRTLAKPEVSEPPAAPKPASNDSTDAKANALVVSEIPLDTNTVDSTGLGFSFNVGDGEYLPIVKVAAVYPMIAQQKRLEGSCMVTYTVTPKGTTQDVSIVSGQCDHSVFERVSIEAAKKFKYKPRVLNGTAIEVKDVYNRFIFKLQNLNG